LLLFLRVERSSKQVFWEEQNLPWGPLGGDVKVSQQADLWDPSEGLVTELDFVASCSDENGDSDGDDADGDKGDGDDADGDKGDGDDADGDKGDKGDGDDDGDDGDKGDGMMMVLMVIRVMG